jgi:uncharacterized protein (TIGR04255 family)
MNESEELYFEKPPIVEAVFDIRAEAPESVTLDVLKKSFDSVKDRFSDEKQNIFFRGGVQFGSGGAPSLMHSATEPYGFSFRSSDGKKIVQSRKDGFTFNNLAPYIGWSSFSREAKELWGYYKLVAQPKLVSRLALRYINRIDLPKEVNDINEYLLTLPRLAKGLPQNLSGFFIRLQLNDDVTKSQAILIATIEPSSYGQGACLVFDIDAFQIVDIVDNESVMWHRFEELHRFKNRLFKESFTPKAKELFR